MNKEKWHQELSQLKLNETQKLRMKKTVKAMQPRKKADWVYRLAMPIFIGLVIFSVYLVFGDKLNGSMVHQAAMPQTIETDHTALFSQLIGHLGTIFLLILGNGYFGYIVFMKTKRWQQPWVVRLRGKLSITHKGNFLLIPIIFVLFLNYLIYLNFPILILNWVIALLLLILHAFILLWLARDANGHLVCPHCQHDYSKKESRKAWRTMLKPLSCPNCKQEVYYSKKSRKLSGLTNTINLVLLFVIFNLGIPFLFIMGCIVIYGVFIVRKLSPLLMELEEKEEFLW